MKEHKLARLKQLKSKLQVEELAHGMVDLSLLLTQALPSA